MRIDQPGRGLPLLCIVYWLATKKNADNAVSEQRQILDRTLDEIPDCQVPSHKEKGCSTLIRRPGICKFIYPMDAFLV